MVTAFGRVHERPALLVRVEDSDGAAGWREVWCNFPEGGMEYRAALLQRIVGPRYLGRPAGSPAELLAAAPEAFRRIAIQCGEPGPFAAALAGPDCALHDLAARRAGVPLAEWLGGGPRPLPACASGIDPTEPLRQIEAARGRGFRAFELKIGFDTDGTNLSAVCADLQPGERFFVDANQAFSPEEARERPPRIAGFGPGRIEEPIPADHDPEVFAALARTATVPLAAGENVAGRAAFEELIGLRAVGVVQPDCGKWGGVGTCFGIAREALAAGLLYCPHWPGGAVGLLHSARLLAAAGGEGLLEIDCNPNPLREELVELPQLRDGVFALPAGPGIGADPVPDILHRYRSIFVELDA